MQAVKKKHLKDSELICSFPPVVADNSQILVLGSMPGEKSLEMRQYYAHPANFFWKFMLQAAGINDNLDYATRLAILSGAGIALWDVLRSCRRHGSLDYAIEKASEQPNAIPELLHAVSADHKNLLQRAKSLCLIQETFYQKRQYPDAILSNGDSAIHQSGQCFHSFRNPFSTLAK